MKRILIILSLVKIGTLLQVVDACSKKVLRVYFYLPQTKVQNMDKLSANASDEDLFPGLHENTINDVLDLNPMQCNLWELL